MLRSHAALVLLVISALLVEDVRSSSKVYTYNLLRAIEETVTEIQSDIQKKDRLAEVGKLFEIDSELDKINRKLQDVTPQRPDDLSRSGGSYGSAELWQMKENFETAEDRLSKLEQRQRMSNKDINDKLEKMINLMTKFYKKNSNTTHIYENTARTTGGQTRTQASNVNALLENLQEFERKFNEEITVIKANVENDVNYLRSRATECDTPPEQVTQDENVDYDDLGDYDDLLKQTRSGGISPAESALEQFSTTLNNTRERIRRDVSTSLRNLDTKIAGIAFTSTRCRQPVIEAAESRTLETRVRPQRSEDPQCTPRSQILRPQSCAALFHAGERCQGTYLVYFDGTNPELAFCDMLSEGGGWTVMMNRNTVPSNGPSLNFTRGWEEYRVGFGDPAGEFWIGNENIHLLSQQGQQELDVKAQASDGSRVNLRFSQFSVGGNDARYKLRLGSALPGYDNSLAQKLRQHNAHPFSTNDQDSRRGQCGPPPVGGWWHVCRGSGLHLTGPEPRWLAWQHHVPLVSIQLMVRPKDFNMGAS